MLTVCFHPFQATDSYSNRHFWDYFCITPADLLSTPLETHRLRCTDTLDLEAEQREERTIDRIRQKIESGYRKKTRVAKRPYDPRKIPVSTTNERTQP